MGWGAVKPFSLEKGTTDEKVWKVVLWPMQPPIQSAREFFRNGKAARREADHSIQTWVQQCVETYLYFTHTTSWRAQEKRLIITNYLPFVKPLLLTLHSRHVRMFRQNAVSLSSQCPSAGQEISAIYGHNNIPPQLSVFNRTDPVHLPVPQFLKTNFYTILPSTPWCSRRFFPSGLKT